MAMLLYALTHYHSTLKLVLEKALATPDLLQKITTLDKKGKPRANWGAGKEKAKI